MFKKQKLDIPDDFIDIIRRYINYEVSDEELSKACKYISRLNVEQHNVIIDIICNGLHEDETSVKYNIAPNCCKVYVDSFYWNIMRRLNVNYETRYSALGMTEEILTPEEDLDMTRYLSVDTTINELYQRGHIGEKGYFILIRNNFRTFGELLERFKKNRMELFQNILKGCESNIIYNLTELCEQFLED